MHTTLRTVDVNLDMQALGHIDAQTAFATQFSEARDASTLLSLIAAAIPPHLDLDDPTDRQSIVDSLTPEQIDMLDSACNDTYVCVDPYAPEMTRFDCPPRTVGFIRVPGDPSPIADTEPGDYMSPHSSYVEWAHDMITTILTGIHPVAGEVPISDYRLRQLFADKRFCRVLKKTGIAPSTLIEAVALRGDPTPVEDEDSHLSPYIHRNENSRWLPPPAPEDCTPPDAARPRPGLPPIVHGWCMSDPYSTPEDDLRDDITAVKRRLIALYPNGTPPGDPIAQALLKRLRELIGETTRQSNWQSRMASIASIFQKRGAHGR
ncbi:MAG: hypothetical protein ACO395_07455 [Pontimonas sp.]